MDLFGIFKSKEADVVSHWYAPVPNFKASTAYFYAAVEKELQAQQVPDLKIKRDDCFIFRRQPTSAPSTCGPLP